MTHRRSRCSGSGRTGRTRHRAEIPPDGRALVALEGVDEDDRPALGAEMVEAIDQYYDTGTNAVTMEYQVSKATVQ